MSHNKMLIDATHPEETRVVVLRNGRVEEFDYESAARRLLRGSIYLAKITRVEPSLQAAFVDYGGNRHGFLAFNEIHPDYYQIPHSDRQALLEEEVAEHREEEEEETSAEDSHATAEAASSDDDTAYEAENDEDAAHYDLREGGTSDEVAEATSDGDEAAPEAVDHSDDQSPEVDAASDTFDPEDNAIDVTHLLPPEPAPETETSEESDEPTGPKSMLAQATGDERIVSDIVVPDLSEEAATQQTETVIADGHTPEDTDSAASPRQEEPPAMEADSGAQEADSQEASTGDAPSDAEDAEADVSLRDTDEAMENAKRRPRPSRRRRSRRRNAAEAETDADPDDDEQVEDVGNEDALEEVPIRRRRRARSYKIQEVIKRRQIVLIQVVKEERGNKGAALTTYLSLAGRYTVLMPNTARGGGISRKITNLQDRKRLKAIAQELDVPEGMGLIIRTAGAARTKQEIKRDFEYLLRLWENVRDLTLQSTAPSLVYEEGDLIKRSIRDLYSKDIDQILVAGADAHKEAKSFMRMLMPSHAKNVIKYEDPQPLFARYGIEPQLNAMFSPFVQLRSGGYLVINQTEALVAVDVNSGKSTKEFSIEETALNTNLEAAEELSRQLKLRDLAGLIVVDFIDMEEKRNNRSVERKLKECLKADRARIQVGRISHFGLLEMSRQRLRTGVLEGSTMQCAHCQGTGIIRSTESVALAVLRGLEDALMTGQPRSLCATTAPNVALYLLNNKRHFIQDMEQRYGILIHVQASDAQQGANFSIDRLQTAGLDLPRRGQDAPVVSMDTGFVNNASSDEESTQASEEDSGERKPRRRRRRRRRDDAEANDAAEAEADRSATADDNSDDGDVYADSETDGDDGEAREGRRRTRRRGRRGGRRNREQREAEGNGNDDVAAPGAPQPDIGFATPPTGTEEDAVSTTSPPEQRPSNDAAVAEAAADDGAPVDAPTLETVSSDIAGTPSAEAGHSDDVPEENVTTSEEAPSESFAAVADTEETDVPSVDVRPIEVAEAPEPAPLPEQAPSKTNGADGNGAARPDDTIGEAGPAPRRSPGASPVAAEPKLERVVVRAGRDTSDGENGESATDDVPVDKPAQKKGWWQRRFGG